MYQEPYSIALSARRNPGHDCVDNRSDNRLTANQEKHSGLLLMLVLLIARPFVEWVRWEKRRGIFPTPLTRWLFIQCSPWLEAVRKGNARWPAMTQVYNHRRLLRGPLDLLWTNIRSCQDLRNRFRIVRTMIQHSVETWLGRRTGKNETVTVLSIACGSGEAVLRACASYGDKVAVHALDTDQTALTEASSVALRYGVPLFVPHLGSFTGIIRQLKDLKPPIVEMVGLGDYLGDETFISLVQKIRGALPEGGYFIVSHIHPNSESYLLEHLCDWDTNMRYRSKEEFLSLLRLAGWADEEMEVNTLPWRMHTVVRCCKRT